MPTTLIPARGLLTVRAVQTHDTLGSGVIVVPDTAKGRLTAWQWDVIAVGPPAFCARRKCDRAHIGEGNARTHVCDVRAGDWIVARPRSEAPLPSDTGGVCVVAQDDVWAVLRV